MRIKVWIFDKALSAFSYLHLVRRGYYQLILGASCTIALFSPINSAAAQQAGAENNTITTLAQQTIDWIGILLVFLILIVIGFLVFLNKHVLLRFWRTIVSRLIKSDDHFSVVRATGSNTQHSEKYDDLVHAMGDIVESLEVRIEELAERNDELSKSLHDNAFLANHTHDLMMRFAINGHDSILTGKISLFLLAAHTEFEPYRKLMQDSEALLQSLIDAPSAKATQLALREFGERLLSGPKQDILSMPEAQNYLRSINDSVEDLTNGEVALLIPGPGAVYRNEEMEATSKNGFVSGLTNWGIVSRGQVVFKASVETTPDQQATLDRGGFQ